MSDNPFGVRRAGPDDIADLLLFVPRVLNENSLLPLSSVKVDRLVERCARCEGGAIAGIIDGPERVDASIGLAFTETDISDEPYLRVVWFGLHPSVRHHPGKEHAPQAHYGRRLFDFAEWCHGRLERYAERPILLQFDILTRTGLTAKMRLYQRRLEQVGAMFAFGHQGQFYQQNPADVREAKPLPELAAAD